MLRTFKAKLVPVLLYQINGGAGILKLPEVTEVNDVPVKVMVAPETKAALVAVKLVNVTVPDTPAILTVPPIVQEPDPTVAVTVAVLVVALPYWSLI